MPLRRGPIRLMILHGLIVIAVILGRGVLLLCLEARLLRRGHGCVALFLVGASASLGGVLGVAAFATAQEEPDAEGY